MSELQILTNHHRRPIVYYWELTQAEKDDFDWIEDSEDNDYTFFRYKGNTYCLSDFMRVNVLSPSRFDAWDGYSADTFFSGVLVKWPIEEWGGIDTDHLIVGTYYS